jgi:hypothetical protein
VSTWNESERPHAGCENRQEKLSKKQAKRERAEEEKAGMEKQIAEALKMFQAQMQLQQAQLSAAASTAAAAPAPGSKSTQLAVVGSNPGGASAPAANTAVTNPPPNFAGAMVAQVRKRERERERELSQPFLEQACNGITLLVDHRGCPTCPQKCARESKASRVKGGR